MKTDDSQRTTDDGPPTTDQPLAVILASGGMDSCVTTAIANLEYRLVCHLSHLRQIGGSCLTDPALAVETANLDRKEIPSSYVPFRNAHFLSIAVSWGEVLGARKI